MPDIELDRDVVEIGSAEPPRHRAVMAVLVAAILGLVGWVVVHPTKPASGTSARTRPTVVAEPTVLVPGSSFSVGTSGRQVVMSFPVRPPGVTLQWVTPAVAPVHGLSDVAIYVVPPSMTDLAPDSTGAIAARAISTVQGTDGFMVVITGTVDCDQAIPYSQPLTVQIQFRTGATVAELPVKGLQIDATDITEGCTLT